MHLLRIPLCDSWEQLKRLLAALFFLFTVRGWCLQLEGAGGGFLSLVWAYLEQVSWKVIYFTASAPTFAQHTDLGRWKRIFFFLARVSLAINTPNCKRENFHNQACFVKPKRLRSLQTLRFCIMCPSLVSNMRWQKRQVLLFLTNNLWLCQHMTICQSLL